MQIISKTATTGYFVTPKMATRGILCLFAKSLMLTIPCTKQPLKLSICGTTLTIS